MKRQSRVGAWVPTAVQGSLLEEGLGRGWAGAGLQWGDGQRWVRRFGGWSMRRWVLNLEDSVWEEET